MAIRNNKLGGTDFADGEILYDYDLDDTNNTVISQFGLTAELAYRTLQANNVWTQGPNLIVDEFTDSSGSQNTVNFENSTAIYEPNTLYKCGLDNEASGDTTHNPNSFTNVDNAFDYNTSTFATLSGGNRSGAALGKTFNSKFVLFSRFAGDVAVFKDGEGSSSTSFEFGVNLQVQTYNGTTWNTVDTISVFYTTGPDGASRTGSFDIFVDINSTIQGLRAVYILSHGDSLTAINAKIVDYGSHATSSTVISDSNTTALDGNEKGFIMSIPDAVLPANTTISATIGDGTNTLTKTAINPTSKSVVVGNSAAFGGPLSAGTLQCTFALETTDNTVTPTLPGYAIGVMR